MTEIRKVAVVGGGVIGGGWVARFAQNGLDVAVYDPDPQAERKLQGLMANAAHAFARLIPGARPAPGRVTFVASLAEAVADADLIQESAPERLDLKQALFAEIDRHARPDALVGSSTSGLLPTDLQARMSNPERLFVAHPFNPVYLVPLVELVAGEKTADATIERARTVYASLGMKPLKIRKEIDAFVGDRLLEALWREALWLVHDDIASVEEIDDVIRYSFGLRWAQMGIFQVYRIAGGEAGMRHFMAQFGPCLKWPWTKLMDVPDLTEALVDKISDQSDEQADGLSIRELERIRDDNLVAIMQALKASGREGWGAGELLKTYEASLTETAPVPEPLPVAYAVTVPADWADYNGHMTEHRYLQVFGEATDVLLARLGLDAAYLAGGHSFFTVETHIRHLAEGKVGDRLAVTTEILSADDKRLRLFHTMRRGETVVATGEHMLLHVDTASGKAVPAGADMAAAMAALAGASAARPRPDGAGRAIGDRR
ncbi:3-hydroxyacyl-CoA dehydrogenase [Aureimonas sp. Leaf454]|uniref:carnitine 3-dehydrogenase n=1 Tax=Aureimonas sp. Leaf454 TaxID=1736381 RepID=UPI0006F3E175|nr:carnitine 3-dehydrogenase [Aureimonas sp. Leaf454]KQT46245.1 3-hydroxyacyl-CoA dehydrogenase [Aureimonas sp. Leaf454]